VYILSAIKAILCEVMYLPFLCDYICALLILVLLYIELLDNGTAGTKHAVVNSRNNVLECSLW